MKRLLMLVILMSMILTPGLIAAQGDDFVCNLDEADCELLQNTLTAMNEVDTVNADTFDFDFTLEVGNSSDAVSFVGTGPLRVGGPNGVELDMSVEDFTVQADNLPLESGATELRIVDGVTYTFDGETWVSYESDSAALTDFYSPANLLSLVIGLSETVGWERGDDIEVDGRELYVYTADIRFGDILASEEFSGLLDSQLESGDVPEADEVPTEMIGLVLGLLGTQLNQGTSQIVFHISPDDNLVYGVIVDIDVEIDFAEMLGAFAGGDAGSLPRLATDLDLTMALNGYGQNVQIEPPEDAVTGDPISLVNALQNSLSGGANGGGQEVSAFAPDVVADLVAGEEVNGVLSLEDNSQFYRFTASQGDVVTIRLFALDDDSNLDTYVLLYDAAGVVLAENDDAGDNPQAGFDSEISSFEIPADGEYLVEATFILPGGEYGLILDFAE